MQVKDYINTKIDNQDKDQNYHVGIELGISSAMLSHYRTGRTIQPSIELAQRVWDIDNIALYPYSKFAVSKGAEDEEV